MRKISKKIVVWLLGAFAFVSLALGFVFSDTQLKIAKADTVTTTWSSAFSVDKIETYTRYRINTTELMWKAYYNESYADNYLANTKLNGRTVKELNDAAASAGSSERIWACLQPADSFSFYSVCVPNSFVELSPEDIYSFSMESTWSHTDSGTGNTYKTSYIGFDKLGSEWSRVDSFVNLDSGDMKFIDQGDGDFAGVNCFLIGFGQKSYTDYLCLNDQHQKISSLTGLQYGANLDSVTINGKTIGQIKQQNANYYYAGSTHPNIKNGGVYAPIFAHLASGNIGRGYEENFIQIYIPNDLIDPAAITEIGLKASLFNYSGTTKYGLTEDITFVKENGSWVDARTLAPATYTVTVDGVAQSVEEGKCAIEPATPTKAEDENYTYTFEAWYIVNTDMVFSFATPITQNYDIEARFTAHEKDVNANVVASGDVTLSKLQKGGEAGEIYTVEITSAKWQFTCGSFDYNYLGDYESYLKFRQNVLINGVSIHTINTTVEDSGYVYSTSPMTNTETYIYDETTYDTFKNPVLLHTSGNTLTLWIHENYVRSLGAGDITITLGEGLALVESPDVATKEEITKVAGRNCTLTATNYDGTVLDVQTVVSGHYATAIADPYRPMTSTGRYTFIGWKDGAGKDFSFASVITQDTTIIAQYDEERISFRETTVLSAQFQYASAGDNWLIFTLSNHDYDCPTGVTEYSVSYEELQRIGLLDNVILKGEIPLGTSTTTEATLAQVLQANGAGEGRFINYWGEGTLGVRIRNTPAYNSIEEIVILSGANFPSYQYACAGNQDIDVRYMVFSEQVFKAGSATQNSEGRLWITPFGAASVASYDISMADGAAIRITQLDDYDGAEDYMQTAGYKQSGIRFQTMISKDSIEQLQAFLGEIYQRVSFGTLIVPSADVTGGEFTHEWLEANGVTYMDVESTAWITKDGYAFATETSDSVSFFGSIVNLKAENHSRYFSGLGYIRIEKGEEVLYYYAPYNKACSRSAAFVAQAAVADRSQTQTEDYENRIDEDNNWSLYTAGEIAFLKLYMGTLSGTEVAPQAFTLTSDGKLYTDNTSTRNVGTLTVNKKLNGAYVQLSYQTNIDVWGQFYYQNEAGTKTAVEDFYLPKGSSQHKQFLDLFRNNGVGTLAGLTQDDLYLTKITFKNATVDTFSTGSFKFLGLYSTAKNLGTLLDNGTYGQEVYVTKALTAGGEMTVGAHLGLGGSLTYLAKSGIYEGIKGQSENSSHYQNYWGYTKYKYNTGSFALSTDPSVFNENRATGDKTTEKGYYGHATSSKPGDGAVNLINNYDAGRQVQQSWYANVGGSLQGNTNENGYTRLDCDTGDGGYWPYNPVQAGDCNSNPGQIIDYEVNQEKGYIYVKARAMDWAYGDTSKGGSQYGVTTKSYMENYYRLNEDGTLYVNNSFVDWNGFTDMDTCDFCLVELPAFYPVHTLNNFFTYDGNSPWTNGAMTSRSDLSQWTGDGTYHYQSAIDGGANGGIGEEWVAWANDAQGSIAFGMYIPNVTRFVSGRSFNSVGASIGENINANNNYLQSLGLMSNMQPIGCTYQSCYVQNTSYTAAGISFKMAAYVPIEYTYVLSVNDISTVRSQFRDIYESGRVTNAGSKQGEKIGLDAWARSDKLWTQF